MLSDFFSCRGIFHKEKTLRSTKRWSSTSCMRRVHNSRSWAAACLKAFLLALLARSSQIRSLWSLQSTAYKRCQTLTSEAVLTSIQIYLSPSSSFKILLFLRGLHSISTPSLEFISLVLRTTKKVLIGLDRFSVRYYHSTATAFIGCCTS